MAEKAGIGCARRTGGPVGEELMETHQKQQSVKKDEHSMIKVG